MDLASLVKPIRPILNLSSDFDPNASLFKTYGKYEFAQGKEIQSSTPGVYLGGGYSGKAFLKKGTILGLNITYISKVWHVWNPEILDTFYDELYPYAHKELLKPLMGICVPIIIGTYSSSGGRISVAMETPHHIGWREADPYISLELKESILDAYQKIHAQGVLHNDVELRHMLIGDDDKITIIDFGIASCKAMPEEFALEMRKVKFVLDYKGAKEMEYARLRRAESRISRNTERRRLRSLAKTKEATCNIDSDEPPSEEEIEYPPFALSFLQEWDSEIETDGRPYKPGWRGSHFEIPVDMRNEPFKGYTNYKNLPLKPYKEINFGECVRKALKGEKFVSHNQWIESSRYSAWLWAPTVPESVTYDPPTAGPLAMISALCRSRLTFSSSVTSDDLDSAEVKSISCGRKRHREVDDGPGEEEEHPRKKLDVKPREISADDSTSTWQLVGPSDIDSAKASSPASISKLVLSRDSSPSESSEVVSCNPRLSRGSPAIPTSSNTNYSVILIDQDDKQGIWSVTKQVLEDIRGYLRVKGLIPSTLEEKGTQTDEYDASAGSDVPVPTHLLRKRKSTDDTSVGQDSSESIKRIKPQDSK